MVLSTTLLTPVSTFVLILILLFALILLFVLAFDSLKIIDININIRSDDYVCFCSDV